MSSILMFSLCVLLQAGIPSHRLVICLEPEAAALFCQSVPFMSQNTNYDFSKYQQCFQPGSKYIIVDAGGK